MTNLININAKQQQNFVNRSLSHFHQSLILSGDKKTPPFSAWTVENIVLAANLNQVLRILLFLPFFFFSPQYGCRVNPGACELQLTLAECWAMEFPTLWLTLLPAAEGLRICSEELPVPGQGWSRSVFLCYLQAGLERATLCAERQESKLCYILQRGQRRKQDTAAVIVKGEKWAVYRTGGEESSKKHKKASEWVGRGTIQLFTSHTPWRMMCVQLRTRVSSFRRLCKHDWGAQLSSFAYCLYFYVIPLV